MPDQQIRDLAARWLEPGQPELSTQCPAALPEGHGVPALRRDPRRLRTRRPTADDEHAPRDRRLLEPVATPLPLAPGRRIDEARDPVIARAAAPAQLIARYARPDLVVAAGAGLGDEVRVSDLAADDADHVGMAGGEDGFGGGRRPDVALRLDSGVTHDALNAAANGSPSRWSYSDGGMIWWKSKYEPVPQVT